MKSFEDNTHSFVVRVWLEPREIEGAAPVWRGVIEHVQSGKRRYLKNLNEITGFITSCIPGMRREMNLYRLLRQSLNCLKMSSKE